MAPTDPKPRVVPSIREASHSTNPSRLRFDPVPALVTGSSSSILIMHSTTAAAVLTPESFVVVVDESAGDCRSSWMPAVQALRFCMTIDTER